MSSASHFPSVRGVLSCFILKLLLRCLCHKLGLDSVSKFLLQYSTNIKWKKKCLLTSLTHQTSKGLDRKEWKKEWGVCVVKMRKARWGDILWSGALLVAILSPYTSIIHFCTPSSLLLTRQCHSIQKAGIEFSKKTNLKLVCCCHCLVFKMRSERKKLNQVESKEFEIQYMQSYSLMLIVIKKRG